MAGFAPLAPSTAPHQPTAADQIALLQKYGPNTARALQQSQYLAQALQSLESSASQNIRTPTALWSNLLADGLLSYSKGKADRDAITGAAADRTADDANTRKGTPFDPAATTTAPASAPPAVPPPSESLIASKGPSADPDAPAIVPRPAMLGPPGNISNPSAGPPSPPPLPDASASTAPQGGAAALASQLLAPSAPPTGQPAQAPPDPLLVRMMLGEAGGEGDTGMSAVGHVALNRVAKHYGGAGDLASVLTAPHQFTGLNTPNSNVSPDSPAYQHAAALAAQLSGQPDMTNGATSFLNPELTQKLYGHVPAWAQGGDGQRIGHHVFFGGDPQMAQGGAPPVDPNNPPPGWTPQSGLAGAPAGPNGGQLLPANMPMQPPGGMPQAGPGPQMAAAGPPRGPQGTQGVPPQPVAPGLPGPPQPRSPGGGGVPHNYVAPEEWAYANSMMQNYRTHDQGAQLMQALKLRAASAIEAPKNMTWDPATGRAIPIPGTEYHQVQGGTPADAAQADPFGQVTHSAIPGKMGPTPEGKMYDPTTGGFVSIAGGQPRQLVTPQERAAAGINPADRAGYAMGADGKVIAGAPDPFGPKDQMAYTAQVTALEPYKNYVLGRGYLSTMQTLMKQPGGFADLGLIENAGKSVNPTIAIRPNMIEQYSKEVGWPDWLQGEVSSVMNHGGHLTEQGRNALMNIAQANVQSHWDQLQPVLKKVDHDAARYGVTREDLIPDLVPMAGPAPQPYPDAKVPTFGGGPVGGGNNAQAALLNEARSAIARGADPAKVKGRLQAAGINPAAL